MTRVDGIKARFASGTWYPSSQWREDIGVLLSAMEELEAMERTTYAVLQQQRQRRRAAEAEVKRLGLEVEDHKHAVALEMRRHDEQRTRANKMKAERNGLWNRMVALADEMRAQHGQTWNSVAGQRIISALTSEEES